MRNGDFIAAIEQFLRDQACGLAIVFDAQYFFTDVCHDPIRHAAGLNPRH
jgi:hypothetical protein